MQATNQLPTRKFASCEEAEQFIDRLNGCSVNSDMYEFKPALRVDHCWEIQMWARGNDEPVFRGVVKRAA